MCFATYLLSFGLRVLRLPACAAALRAKSQEHVLTRKRLSVRLPAKVKRLIGFITILLLRWSFWF